MEDKKELNMDQMDKVAGGSIVISNNETGKLKVYDNNDSFTGASFDKDHAKEAMAYDEAVNGPRGYKKGAEGTPNY